MTSPRGSVQYADLLVPCADAMPAKAVMANAAAATSVADLFSIVVMISPFDDPTWTLQSKFLINLSVTA